MRVVRRRIEHGLHGPLSLDRIYAQACDLLNTMRLPNIILHWSQRSGTFPVFFLCCSSTKPSSNSGFACVEVSMKGGKVGIE